MSIEDMEKVLVAISAIGDNYEAAVALPILARQFPEHEGRIRQEHARLVGGSMDADFDRDLKAVDDGTY